MHFSKIAVLVPFVLALAAAAPAAEPAPQPEAIAELEDIEQLHQLTKRGFGCPLNRQECNDHVRNPSFTIEYDE